MSIITQEEFILWLNNCTINLGMWIVEPKEKLRADYVLGCFFDNTTKTWKVYENDDKAVHRVKFETVNEKDAYTLLQRMVKLI